MNKSGIYKIVNISNNNFYIGSTNSFYKRKNNHFYQLNKGIHSNTYLQRSWNKYGKSNFKFEIVELCEVKDLLAKEQYYIDTLKPKYNLCRIANSTKGRVCSESTRLKISNKNKGKIRSIETIVKLKRSWNGKYNSAKKLYLLNENKEILKFWRSSSDAAKEFNMSRCSLARLARKNNLIKSKKSKLKGFIITYNPDNQKE